MAVLTLSYLKTTKNSVIGNPSAKVALAQNESFVKSLVGCLNSSPTLWQEPQGSLDDVRVEAAHIIASLSYGSETALSSLLRANTAEALIYAIGGLKPGAPNNLKSALTRALRALAAAIAEAVGPSQWGLRAESTGVRFDAKLALDIFFQVECLDIYLPLLEESSAATTTSICQLLASAVRDPVHRKAVSEWLPPSDRVNLHRGRRWEKPDAATSHAPGRQGGWLARHLISLLSSRDVKLQEAALSALAAVAKDNANVANALAKQAHGDSVSPLTKIVDFTKSRSPDVQLAACLCATHIVRISSPNHAPQSEDPVVITIINLINRFLDMAPPAVQTKACYVLFNLVKDDSYHCDMTRERHSLEKLAMLLRSTAPNPSTTEWDEDDPESVCALREAAMTVLATICIFDPRIQQEVCDTLGLIPVIQASLNHRHVGVRYAACQCVRAFSREISILRTTMLDSGLGLSVFQIFLKPDEDRRVTFAALMCVCNLVNDFSPLRPIFMSQGLMPRLAQLMQSEDPALRANAMWAIKNLLNRASPELKAEVMEHLTWPSLHKLLGDTDDDIREQAFTVVQNLADNEAGVELVLREIGEEALLSRLVSGLGSSSNAVVFHATCLLANLLNGTELHQNSVIKYPKMLELLRSCLEGKPEVRRPAVMCVLQVAKTNPTHCPAIIGAGILTTLKAYVAGHGSHDVSIGTPSRHAGSFYHPDDTNAVTEQAKQAIFYLEHGDIGGIL